LASHRSKPLAHLVRYMLVHSNNLYADSIAKNLTYEYLGKTATYTRMALAIRRVLKERAGIDLAEAHIVDGSGLSPHNLITPRQMLSLLEFVKANDSTLGLIDMLPLAGKTGTLAFRASVTQKPLREHVRGKTGTLVNVSNLAGFVTSASGASIPFVIFTNSITHSPRERDRIRNGATASSHYGYERYVLEQIQAERHFSPGKR
ncbi:MAG: D-alanyl-D-alanine carboxypeptidase/D-alanyl-D-alanine-endopeptidase, partial [Succinivibrionaceae bacterium]|nr:D-alanyl-D-alanine carboxypeptidase/D-alanyl-D-alanine-endopeptidase [Succinivibrionaceae bacterium]